MAPIRRRAPHDTSNCLTCADQKGLTREECYELMGITEAPTEEPEEWIDQELAREKAAFDEIAWRARHE